MSSPRQKMVIVVPNEPEQKKKRQTLERAKANHLSRQLQMRLQYAKLKVEHGWQRQNLNEVENLYFHHSHQRSMRQGAGQRHHYATVTYLPGSASTPAETHTIHSPTPLGVPDHMLGSASLTNDASSSGSVSPPSQSPPEPISNVDGRPLSQPQPGPAGQAPVTLVPPIMTNRPPSVLDLTDPTILARLAQLQAQVQLPLQSQAQAQTHGQTLSRHTSTTIPPLSSTSVSASQPTLVPVPVPVSSAFSPHVQFSQPPTSHPQGSFTLSLATQPLGTSTASAVPLFPLPASTPNNNNLSVTPQTTLVSTPAAVPIPTTSIPTPTLIAPSALTYDSFWSTHGSSTGPTRALYRTHTGFTASAAPGGNVAMLTPGGNAAIMTAEGVYVGGGSK